MGRLERGLWWLGMVLVSLGVLQQLNRFRIDGAHADIVAIVLISAGVLLMRAVVGDEPL